MWGPLVGRGHSGPGVGSGHLMRLLALVEGWTAAGDRAVVLGPDGGEPVADRLSAAGAEVVPLGAVPGTPEDAAALAALAADDGAAWIALDGAPFGPGFQEVVAHTGARVLVIDDHGHHGRYVADVVLDQNLGADAGRYEDSGGARRLLGARYALLRRELTRLAPQPAPERTPQKLTVVLGGAPTPEVRDLGTSITAEVRRAHPQLDVDWRIGGDQLRRPWAETLAATDLAVSAAGSTSWELCYFGIPSILVGVAADQMENGVALAQAGAARWTGRANGVTVERVAEAVDELVGDATAREGLSGAARRLVDGRGVSRVLAELRAPLLRLRDVGEADAPITWSWANDPQTRASSFTAAAIPWDHHQQWLASRQRDPDRPLYLAHGPDGSLVGQVRFDPHERRSDREIGVTVAPAARGFGVAAPLILAGSRRAAEDRPGDIHAYVRPENEASAAAFTAAGYDLVGPATRKGMPALHYRWGGDRAH